MVPPPPPNVCSRENCHHVLKQGGVGRPRLWCSKRCAANQKAASAVDYLPSAPVKASWLVTQFLVCQRSVEDLAEEIGVGVAQVSAWLERMGISYPSITRSEGPPSMLARMAVANE